MILNKKKTFWKKFIYLVLFAKEKVTGEVVMTAQDYIHAKITILPAVIHSCVRKRTNKKVRK